MSKIEAKAFADLFNTAKKSTEESVASPSIASMASENDLKALQDTFEDTTKAAKVLAQKAKCSFKYFENNPDTEASIESKSVPTVVNWLVHGFHDLIEKLNDQGELIAAIVKKSGKEIHEDFNKKNDALVKKCSDLENRADDFDKRLNETDQTDLHQKELDLENRTSEMAKDINTSLAAPGALAHQLQRCTACKIQNGRWGLERYLPLGFWAF